MIYNDIQINFRFSHRFRKGTAHMPTTKPTYGTVLIKADAILDTLATNHGQTLTEIAAATGFTRSTTLKILDTLLQLQYVEKNDHNKKYQIGSAFLKYSDAYLNTFSIVNLCHPDLIKLRDEFGETVHLGTMENDDLIYLDKFPGKKSITVMTSKIGVHAPLYATGMGKGILSTFGKNHLSNYLATHPLTPLTKTTVTNQAELLRQIAATQKNHLAYDDSERDEDVYCIATTITAHNKLFGAFSISIPSYRLTPADKQAMEQAILKTKQAIEDKLTYVKTEN